MNSSKTHRLLVSIWFVAMLCVGSELLPLQPSWAVFPGTNGKLIFDSNRDGRHWQIYTMDADGANVTQLTFDDTDVGEPVWSPDGSKIAFSGWVGEKIQIFVMNADGSGKTQLTYAGKWNSQPTWSPDGQKIAYVGWDNTTEIYVMNSDGSNRARLTNTVAHEAHPAWSPDGSRIAFSSNREINFKIYIMNVDGTDIQKLTESDGSDYQPNWSPDGHKIVFASDRTTPTDRGGDSEIFVMNSDGSNLTQLTFNSVGDGDPVWSPDGKYIAFVRYDNKHYPFVGRQIFVTNADGSDEVVLTNTTSILSSRGGGNWGLDWQPKLNRAFTITFEMLPVKNGSITFDHVSYLNGDVASKPPGTYRITANPTTGYQFVKWETAGGVSVGRADAAASTCTILGAGTLRLIQTSGSTLLTSKFRHWWPWVRIDQISYPSESGTILSSPPPKYYIITNPWATGYAYNTTVEFTAIPTNSSAWEFVEWELQGGVRIVDNPLHLFVQQDSYVRAVFRRRATAEAVYTH